MVDDAPKTNAEIVELAKYTMNRAPDARLPDTPNLFVSYLIHECGIGRLRLKNVLKDVWSDCVRLRRTRRRGRSSRTNADV